MHNFTNVPSISMNSNGTWYWDSKCYPAISYKACTVSSSGMNKAKDPPYGSIVSAYTKHTNGTYTKLGVSYYTRDSSWGVSDWAMNSDGSTDSYHWSYPAISLYSM